MAQVLVEEQSLSDTAAAIRSRLGGQDTYKPREFAAAINSIVDYATVTQTLTHASSSSNKTRVVKGESFTTDITPDSDYRITAITVTMGGQDITDQVFKPGVGEKAITANGTYNASSDGLSGYSKVVVNVSGGGGGTPAISVVDTTDSHGGTVREITALDISDTTAVAGDVTQGKYFYTAQGVKTAGTGSGGTPSATQHTIYFEFSDNTNTTINAWYDDSFISNAITATTPTTYGGKTVTLAQLDGVTWYETGGGDIPLNTELVDYTKVMTGYAVQDSGAIENTGQSWDAISDYIPIDPSMTFTFKTNRWYYVGFYNSSKNIVSAIQGFDIESSSSGDVSIGTLNASNIPSTAAYIILSGNAYNLQNSMSLIRTA